MLNKKINILLLGLFIIIFSCTKEKYNYEVLKLNNGTYGYTIFLNGNPFIEQTTRPTAQDTLGFKNPENAKRIAELVIEKLKTKKGLPTITKEELNEK